MWKTTAKGAPRTDLSTDNDPYGVAAWVRLSMNYRLSPTGCYSGPTDELAVTWWHRRGFRRAPVSAILSRDAVSLSHVQHLRLLFPQAMSSARLPMASPLR